MGNTILAHVIFSCNKANLNLDNFFSVSGDSHKIQSFKNTELTAKHLLESPDSNANCILQLTSDGWFRVLQYYFSYSKWFYDFPNINNWRKFFNYIPDTDQQQHWQTFYSDIKDESWPECNSIDDIDALPSYIQTEVKQNYQYPLQKIDTDHKLLEFLTMCYFDSMSMPNTFKFDAPVYKLSDYFDYKIIPLIKISKLLNWQWDEELSKKFYNKMLEVNSKYLKWLDTIKQYHDMTVNGIVCPANLDVWEKALVIAKICQTLSCNPRRLKWQDSGCILEHTNATLIKLLRG